jgi:hypothetical protein
MAEIAKKRKVNSHERATGSRDRQGGPVRSIHIYNLFIGDRILPEKNERGNGKLLP